MYDCVECLRPLEQLENCEETRLQHEHTEYSLMFCDTCKAHYLIVDIDKEEHLTSYHLIFAIALTPKETKQVCSLMSKHTEIAGDNELAIFAKDNEQRQIIIKNRQYDPWY